MKTVYLCGAINGCTDEQAKDWRELAKSRLAGRYNILDPMRRDYRGKEDESVREIVEGDYADIDACDVVLVAADKPSWGTAMEMHHAKINARKYVVAFCGAERISPWLRYHSHELVPSLHLALAMLEETA